MKKNELISEHIYTCAEFWINKEKEQKKQSLAQTISEFLVSASKKGSERALERLVRDRETSNLYREGF